MEAGEAIDKAVATVQRALVKAESPHVETRVAEFRTWAVDLAEIAVVWRRGSAQVREAQARGENSVELRAAQSSVAKLRPSFDANVRSAELRIQKAETNDKLRRAYIGAVRTLAIRLKQSGR